MISGSLDGNSRIFCMSKVFKKFQAAMRRLRHIDVTMTLTSSGVVIRSLPDGGLSFYCKAVGNVFADDNVFVHYVQNCVTRLQHVYLRQEVKTWYFCNLSIA